MKKYKSSLKLLAVIFAAMFMLNMTIMYVFFDINVLNPRASLQDGLKAARTGDDELLAAALEAKAAGNNALRESSPAIRGETDMMPDTAGEDTGTSYGALTSGDTDYAAANIYKSNDYCMKPNEIAFLNLLSLEDKLSAITILSKLGTEELDRIYEMSLDGVTFAEYADIKASLENKLEMSDVEELKEILYRNKMLYAKNGR